MRKFTRWTGCGLALILLQGGTWHGVSQTGGFPAPQPPSLRGGGQNPGQLPGVGGRADDNPQAADQQARMERTRNNERQKRLVADTDKLLELATKLHEDVGKTDKNILSLDVVNRAQQIEKLAHDVKERMKG